MSKVRKLEIHLQFPDSLLDHEDGIVEYTLVQDARKVIRGAIRKEREAEAE